jgi:uncharacterized membrane protein YphA (DoxX/SURF4 family)
MKILLTAARYHTGLLFIFSGLIKANDPLGLSYKMQEFFELWHLESLHDFTLAFSIIIIAFEIISGVAVIVGWKMKLFSWLLLLLILFFTFLTAYALFSGKVRECGCFGDCIPLQANQSFIKDLVLLGLIAFIFAYRNKIKTSISSQAAIAIILFTTVASFSFQWFVLRHLPVLDCLPYKKGNNIPAKLLPPAGSIPDSTVITFVYEKAGKELEFTATDFPADFNDTAYKYVRRYDKLIRKGNAEPAIKDFTLQTLSGTDTTLAVLSSPGNQLYLFLKDGYQEGEWNGYVDMIRQTAAQKGTPVFLVTNLSPELVSPMLPGLTVLRCDATAIKTAARANPTLIQVRNGTIIEKWAFADFNKALESIGKP